MFECYGKKLLRVDLTTRTAIEEPLRGAFIERWRWTARSLARFSSPITARSSRSRASVDYTITIGDSAVPPTALEAYRTIRVCVTQPSIPS